MSLSTGTKLSRYEIRSKIGEGGMGEVYLAQDTKLDRKVALKVLPADLAAHQDRMRGLCRTPRPHRRSIIPTSSRVMKSTRSTRLISSPLSLSTARRCASASRARL